MAVSLSQAVKDNVSSCELYKTSVESNDFNTAFKLMSGNYDDIKCVELRNHSTPLHYACLYGNISAVETLVKTFQLGIDDKDDTGCTPLSLAVQCGYYDIFKFLLQHTLDKNFTVSAEPCSSHSNSLRLAFQEKLVKYHSDKHQNNLLYQATIHGQSEIMTFLNKNLDFDGTNLHEIKHLNSLNLAGGTVPVIKFQKTTPSQVPVMYELMHTIKSMESNSTCHSDINELLLLYPLHASRNIVELLSEKYHCTTEELSHTKSAPLHVAAIYGHFEVMKHLINNLNFDPNIVGVHGRTALYYACSNGHHEVTKYLIEECHCNSDTRFEKDTQLHIAAAHGHLDLVKYFVEDLNIDVDIQGLMKWTPLFYAVQNGYHDIIKYLIETCHCDASMRDECNVAPLHIAAIYGHLDIVKYFVNDLNINCSIPGFNKQAPLHYASPNGHYFIIKILTEECHCNPNKKNEDNETPLHYVVRSGHLNLVKYFVEELSVNASIQDLNELTSIHYACQNGHLDIIKYLIENGHCAADTNAIQNILHCAVLYGHLDLVKYFVDDLNMDPNTRGFQEFAPLHHASANGHHNVVKYLIENCHCNVDIRNVNNNTPLHIATDYGHLDLVKYFVEDLNMDPNTRGFQEWAPLHDASANGHYNIVKYLVENCHCNVDIRDEDNNNPLHIAALNGHLDLVKYFVDDLNMDPNTRGFQEFAPLHHASANGHHNVVKYLIENCHCNVDIRNVNNDTPLHIATDFGHLDLVKYLVEDLNMDPNTRGFQEWAPLHDASANGHYNIVKYLVENCHCNVDIRDEDNDNPLHIAALNGHLDLVKYFVEDLNMDPNTRGFKDRAPLHHASANGHHNVVKYLIENCHCNVDIRNVENDTPLHIATGYGHLDLVKYFVEDLNMDPNTRGFQECAPLHDASANGHHNIVKYLVENCHCNVDIRDEDNDNPLHFAASNGHLDLVKYFVEDLNMGPNTRGFQEGAPLHHASANGHQNIVKYLVENCHCKTDIRTKGNNTPLHIVAMNGHLDLVKYFEEDLKVDINTRGFFNKTPLHSATSEGHLNVVKYYVESHQLLDFCISRSKGFTDKYGILYFYSNDSLLFKAARNGHTDIFRYICNYCRIDPAMLHNYTNIQNISNEDTLHYIRTYADPLHEAAIKGDLDKVKYYIESIKWSPLLRDRHGNNILHNAAQNGHLKVIKYLLSSRKSFNKLLIQNKFGLLPEELALKNDFFNVASYIELISNKAVKIKRLPFVHTILVMGNSSSGKTTLTKSIMNKNSWLGWYRQVRGVASSTAGVVPHFIEDDEIGSLKIYDFAGHEEFYASHENILQHFKHPLILIVVDISLPIRKITEQLAYWVTINQNSITKQIISLLVIASHIDISKDKINCIEANKFMEAMISENSLAISYHGILECDCRYSGSTHMKEVLIKIGEICRQIHLSNLKDESKEANKLCLSFRTYLVENQMTLPPALKLGDVFEKLKQDKARNSNLAELCNEDKLMKTFQLLHFNGCLLIFPDDCCFMDSFLILNEDLILDNLHSSMKNIIEKIENKIGMIEENELKTIYQSSIVPIDPNASIKYLIFAQFCTLVSSESLVLSNNLSSIKKNYYFFPNLVEQERPFDALVKVREYTESYTWVLKCNGSNQFFTPRCIHNLFIVLARRKHNHTNLKIDIWKNGILQVNGQFVRSVIEFTDQTRRINLEMQCKKEHQLDLVKERSELTAIIKSLVRKLCPSFTLSESFLYAKRYPLCHDTEIPICDILSSIRRGDSGVTCQDKDNKIDTISLKELLYSDSFHSLRKSTFFHMIVNSHFSNEKVSFAILENIKTQLKDNDQLVENLNKSLENRMEITFSELVHVLLQYSIVTEDCVQVSPSL